MLNDFTHDCRLPSFHQEALRKEFMGPNQKKQPQLSTGLQKSTCSRSLAICPRHNLLPKPTASDLSPMRALSVPCCDKTSPSACRRCLVVDLEADCPAPDEGYTCAQQQRIERMSALT